MLPYSRRSRQSGFTLIEMIVVIGLGALIFMGLMEFLSNSEKQGRIQKLQQETKEEVANFGDLIKKIWNIRLRNTNAAVIGVPPSGFFLKINPTGSACTGNCAYLKLYALRSRNSVSMIDNITIENACVPFSSHPTSAQIASLNIPGKMTGSCSSCPADQLPIVRISSVFKNANNSVALADTRTNENAIYPSNLRDQAKFRKDGTLGMQACFNKSTSDTSLIINLRTFHMTLQGTNANVELHSLTIPDDNFARIQLIR